MSIDAEVLGVPRILIFAAAIFEYHVSEVLLVLAIEPAEFEFPASLLLSRSYVCAMAISLIEYFYVWNHPSLLDMHNRVAQFARVSGPIGLGLVVGGEVLRKTAWLTARNAFTHRIKTVRRPDHQLVTYGVYSFVRHPGYVGWLLWAVGTQLLLGNPISTVGFLIVSWRFFSVRIPYEDHHLGRLFGKRYEEYRMCVRSGIPGIS